MEKNIFKLNNSKRKGKSMKAKRKALITGSGFYDIEGIKRIVSTEYGNAILYEVFPLENKEPSYILPRHGIEHSLPPARINYKANIAALKALSVEEVLTIHAVGSIKKSYSPSSLVWAEDFIGFFTPITFFESFKKGIKHADLSNPFSKQIIRDVERIARKLKIKIKRGGVVATTPGNRFETKAEILALKKLGANLVSMTHSYEATLLSELEMRFASLCVVTNYAAGLQSSLSHQEVIDLFKKMLPKIKSLALEWLRS